MELPADVRAQFLDAGSGALRFNAPMGDDRAARLVDELARLGPRTVVDLGCGRGELAHLAAVELTDATVIGVDTDSAAITTARRLAEESGLGDRLLFEVADAATWTGSVDAALCIGASHAFGGPAGLVSRLTARVPTDALLIGDGVWVADPDRWCRTTFGELPRGVDGLVALAAIHGWTAVAADESTRDEWDTFEATWVAGVRSVGTPAADAFAARRERDYHHRYRSVLGFAWVVLTR